MFRAGCWVAALIVASWSVSASALGLGEIEVQSKLYEPFRAVIPLVDATQSDIDNLQVHVASDEDFAHQGMSHSDYLSTLHFEVRSDGGAPRVVITSNVSEREPILDLVVETRWQGTRFVTAYTLLFDPPQSITGAAAVAPPAAAEATTTATPVAPPMPAPAPKAKAPKLKHEAPAPENALPRPTTVKKPKPAAPKLEESVPPPVMPKKKASKPKPIPPPPTTSAAAADLTAAASGTNAYGPVKPGETLWSIATKVRPGPSVSMSQVMLALYLANPKAFTHGIEVMSGARLVLPSASNMTAVSAADASAQIETLRKGGALTTPTSVPPASESASHDSELMNAAAPLGTPEAPPPSVEIHTAASSADSAGKREASSSAASTAAAAASSVAVAEQPATATTVASSSSTAPVAPSSVAALAGGQATSQPPPRSASAATPPPAGASDEIPWLWIGLGLGLLVLLLIIWMLSRRKKDSDPDPFVPRAPVPPPRIVPIAVASIEPPSPTPAESPAPEASPEEPLNDHQAKPGSIAEDFDEAEASRTPPNSRDAVRIGGAPPLELGSDTTDPIVEADSHLEYGLYDEAAAVLQNASEREPERTDLRMKLAETYYKAGRPADFQVVAEGLQGQISGAAWNRLAEWGSELSPDVELFHHRAPVEIQSPYMTGADKAAFDEGASVADQGGHASPPFSLDSEPGLDLSEFDLDKPLSAEEEIAEHSLDFNLDDFDLGEVKPEGMATSRADDLSSLAMGESPDHPVEHSPEYVHDELASNQFDDEVGTKLDLARAYADMGDTESARALLNEAVTNGSEQQKHEAEALLARLGEG